MYKVSFGKLSATSVVLFKNVFVHRCYLTYISLFIFSLGGFVDIPYSFPSCVYLSRLGCISLGKILIRILNPKTDFLFLWQNPKKDYESNESVRDEDSMD